MYIAWTTVATREDALRLARLLVERRLAACVQIEGPVTSVYVWEGKTQQAEEFRLTIKYVAAHSTSMKDSVLQLHPYSNPEWLAMRVTDVSEKYLSWAQANSTNPPL